ncbi:hypothetical protein AAHZ94_09030 [Streptomyces sp. HSW2009]|uniref:hypothetical protein n=1 Tax=Streptomyces sp. HSW2009 TaxID=3142890 RepID=UPI0032EE00F8
MRTSTEELHRGTELAKGRLDEVAAREEVIRESQPVHPLPQVCHLRSADLPARTYLRGP